MTRSITTIIAKTWQQYVVAVLTFAGVTLLCFWVQKWTGYQAVALIYLLSVVMLALFVGRGPVLIGTTLTALGWNYYFSPPVYSFKTTDPYDGVVIVTYFIVTWLVCNLMVRLRAQREVELKSQLLTESERLGRTLLNSVSHELRTPISAISSAASAMRAGGNLTTSQQEMVAEIESASSRLNRVVQSLLSAARLQSGHLHPKLDWCDVRDVVRAALRETSELTVGHPLETRIDAGLPLVKMDFVLMEQVIANLLANAAVHTPPKTPVEIRARLNGKDLLLQVADRGPGLPPDQQERVFDMFHRAPNARPGGTGLGLAIVKGFVEAQGGRVTAANGPNGGAVFSIFLPAADQPDMPDET